MKKLLLLSALLIFACSSDLFAQGHISDGTNFKVPNGFVKLEDNSWENKNNSKEFISIQIKKGNKKKTTNKSQSFNFKTISINGVSYDLFINEKEENISIAFLSIYFEKVDSTFIVFASANKKNYERCEELIRYIVQQFKTPQISQNEIVFKEGKSVKLSVLNNQLIDVFGEDDFLISKSTAEDFAFCFFSRIASNSSYKTYQEDLSKTERHSQNIDERIYFLYKIKYINSALWSCMDENPQLISEYSKVDKIIPQSVERIKAFAEELSSDFKNELSVKEYTEIESKVDLENYFQCVSRKMWDTFTPKEMINMSLKNEKRKEELEEICFSQNLKIPTLEKKYDSDYITDDSVLAEYVSFINDPKSKGLDFKIKSPKGFANTFANSPNIIRLWRKENATENDDPWIYILILEGKMYDNKIEFEKTLIEKGGMFMYAKEFKNPSNISYFSTEDYPGMLMDYENSNGQKLTLINLWMPNHSLQFYFAERKSNNYDYNRDILIAFAKSIKFL